MSEPAARPAGCHAIQIGAIIDCRRCGLEWPLGEAGPACSPIKFEHLCQRMAGEVARSIDSHAALTALRRKGMPADPAPERRRLAELEAVRRLVDRVNGDAALKGMLNTGGAQAPAERGGEAGA